MSFTSPRVAVTVGSTMYELTPNLDKKRYEVNKRRIYQEWTDANWIDHRETVRTRVTGRVHFGFKTTAARDSFQSTIDSGRDANGRNRLYLLVPGEGMEIINAFVTLSDESKWDVTNQRVWYDVTMLIEEA